MQVAGWVGCRFGEGGLSLREGVHEMRDGGRTGVLYGKWALRSPCRVG